MVPNGHPRNHYIPLIRHYCQKVLPAVYDDSLSYYECICKLVHKINEIIEAYAPYGDTIKNLQDAVEELQKELEEFKNHGFDDYYKEQVKEWIANNLEYVFTHVAKQVFFGLTLDGYFCAWVPTSWEDIVFDTGAVYGRFDYGRLILRWCADNTHICMQPNSGIFEEQFAADFQENLDRLNRTCYTVINEGDELV